MQRFTRPSARTWEQGQGFDFQGQGFDFQGQGLVLQSQGQGLENLILRTPLGQGLGLPSLPVAILLPIHTHEEEEGFIQTTT